MTSWGFVTEASSRGAGIDRIVLLLLAMTTVLVVLMFAVRHRRGSKARRGRLPAATQRALEVGWTAATLFLFMFVSWSQAKAQGDDPARAGEELFRSLGCSGCHVPNSNAQAPRLVGLWGRRLKLTDGSTVVADEAYIRNSILTPEKQIAAGYKPTMPSYRDIVKADQMIKLLAYLKSLSQRSEKP